MYRRTTHGITITCTTEWSEFKGNLKIGRSGKISKPVAQQGR